MRTEAHEYSSNTKNTIVIPCKSKYGTFKKIVILFDHCHMHYEVTDLSKTERTHI